MPMKTKSYPIKAHWATILRKSEHLLSACHVNFLSKYLFENVSFLFRYSVALAQPEYNDIDEELSKQFFNFIHKYENSHEASDSWYDTSCQGHTQYWICEGDPLLNWKDQGYRTVFDLLQVTTSMRQLMFVKNTVIPLISEKSTKELRIDRHNGSCVLQ